MSHILVSRRPPRSTARANGLTRHATAARPRSDRASAYPIAPTTPTLDAAAPDENAPGVREDPELVGRDLTAMMAGLSATGVDVERLTELAGIDLRLEGVPPDELGAIFSRLWTAAITLTRDPSLPLAAGDAVPFGAYEIVDYLASSCPSLGAGLGQVARYFRLITPNLSWHIEAANDPPLVTLESHHVDPQIVQVSQQYAIGVTFGRFRRMTEGEFSFASVDLALPAPPDDRHHRAFFGAAAVRYDAPLTILRIPRRVWNLPLQRQEPGLRRLLERHAESLLARELAEHDPLAELRAAVRARLCDGDLKVEAIARELATSTRTLQRRLAESGTSFQATVDEERRRAAQSYLREARLAVGDVAYMVGYSEPSAFVRAFKRWTGETPRSYRRRSVSSRAVSS